METRPRRWRRQILKTVMLVVIVILAIIMLPRVGRYLLIRACPIVYVAEGGRIHLTNQSGTIDVELEGPAAGARVSRPYSPPSWSPGGEYLGYQCLDAWDGTSHVAVLRPSSGERWVHASKRGTRFLGWVDDRAWLEGGRVREARTGAVIAELPPQAKEVSSLIEAFQDAPRVPIHAGQSFRVVHFCDWTPEGNILANVQEAAGWTLVVLDKGGKLVRRIETEVRPQGESGAS